jgi:predicted RND superfamily exporter protein
MENGIVLVSRYRENRAGRFAIPRSTGLGVLLASTTTIVGFGSLMVARHRGVHSVGLLLALAVGCVLAASFTALPALLRLAPHRRPSADSTSWHREISQPSPTGRTTNAPHGRWEGDRR